MEINRPKIETKYFNANDIFVSSTKSKNELFLEITYFNFSTRPKIGPAEPRESPNQNLFKPKNVLENREKINVFLVNRPTNQIMESEI